MRFLIILLLSFISSFFLPWWISALIAFLAAFFIGKTSGQAFLAGFGAVFIAWIVLALLKSVSNNNILAKRVATMFHLPHWIFLLLITALIGGIVAGMAALSGILLKKIIKK